MKGMTVDNFDEEFAELIRAEIADQRPYEDFRRQLRVALTSRGWQLLDQDEESDYLVKGRFYTYCTPGDSSTLQFHVIVIMEFLSSTLRSEFLRTSGLVGGVEPASIVYEFSVPDA